MGSKNGMLFGSRIYNGLILQIWILVSCLICMSFFVGDAQAQTEITLNGSSPVTVEFGSSYLDAGATAWDNVDGDITDRIVTGGLLHRYQCSG